MVMVMGRIAVAWAVRRMGVLNGAEQASGTRGARGCDADSCHNETREDCWCAGSSNGTCRTGRDARRRC